MQLEIGKIYNGKVKGITQYGAFVDIDGGGTGMVHISEIANTYVSDIREHLTEEQEVQVKVIGINEQGKVSLSIKKVSDNGDSQPVRDALTRVRADPTAASIRAATGAKEATAVQTEATGVLREEIAAIRAATAVSAAASPISGSPRSRYLSRK